MVRSTVLVGALAAFFLGRHYLDGKEWLRIRRVAEPSYWQPIPAPATDRDREGTGSLPEDLQSAAAAAVTVQSARATLEWRMRVILMASVFVFVTQCVLQSLQRAARGSPASFEVIMYCLYDFFQYLLLGTPLCLHCSHR